MTVHETTGPPRIERIDQQHISDAVKAIADNRAVIDQAKGILMFIYGIDHDQAFHLLRWQSQQHNVKLRLLAEQIVKDLVELSRSTPSAHRHDSDNLLLTAHQRVADVAHDNPTAKARLTSE